MKINLPHSPHWLLIGTCLMLTAALTAVGAVGVPQAQAQSQTESPTPAPPATTGSASVGDETATVLPKPDSADDVNANVADEVANSVAAAEATQRPRFEIKKHGAIVYHTGETYLLKCDVYQPISEVDSDKTRPAVVMIHGGAWRTGSKFTMLRHARRLARVGYVAMVINYRLAPKYPWPAQIEDCRDALGWLKENAATYNVDPDRVGVYGYSAGAQMAAILANTNEQNDQIKIRAAAVGGTPAEFSWIDKNANTLVYWLGATRADDADLYLRASPTHFVTDDDPPFLIFHGVQDKLVPIESARKLHRKLQEKDIPSQLIELPENGHLGAFSNMDLIKDVIKFFDTHL